MNNNMVEMARTETTTTMARTTDRMAPKRMTIGKTVTVIHNGSK